MIHPRDVEILRRIDKNGRETCGLEMVRSFGYGQWIYPKLRQLQERGLLSSHIDRGFATDKVRVWYWLTDAGKEAIK